MLKDVAIYFIGIYFSKFQDKRELSHSNSHTLLVLRWAWTSSCPGDKPLPFPQQTKDVEGLISVDK